MTRKILVVEDDASTSAYLAKGLSEAGYAVEAAHDGRDGLFLASEGIFDLIIADHTRKVEDLRGRAVTQPAVATSLNIEEERLAVMLAAKERLMNPAPKAKK